MPELPDHMRPSAGPAFAMLLQHIVQRSTGPKVRRHATSHASRCQLRTLKMEEARDRMRSPADPVSAMHARRTARSSIRMSRSFRAITRVNRCPSPASQALKKPKAAIAFPKAPDASSVAKPRFRILSGSGVCVMEARKTRSNYFHLERGSDHASLGTVRSWQTLVF